MQLGRSRLTLALVALAAVVLAFAGWRFVLYEINVRLATASAELGAVTELKALQLAEWHRERIDDALGRSGDPFFVASVSEWLAGNRSPQLERRLQEALTPRREPWRYRNVWLLDLQGRRIFDARRTGAAADLDAGLLAECTRQRQPAFDLLRNIDTAAPFMDICMQVVELRSASAMPAGVQVYRADASQLLLPTLEFFPRADASRVTMLLRFDRGAPQVVMSSNKAFQPGQAPPIVPEGFVSSGNRHRTELDVPGPDGRRRLVATRPVANTPWAVLVALDRGDLLRGVYEYVAVAALLTAALGVTGWLSLLLILQRREQLAARQTLRLDRLLQVRSAINEAIVRIRPRPVMLSRFCELAVSMGRFEFAAVYERQPDRDTARLEAWHGRLPEKLAGADDVAIGKGLREGPMRTLFDDGQVAIVPDLEKEPRNAWTEAKLASGHRAIVALPIRENNRITGSFWMYSGEPGVFDRRDVQFFDELAADISYALENIAADEVRLETELQLNAVFDAAPFAMFLVGRDDGRIIRANAAAVRQYAYGDTELIGQSAAQIFGPADLEPPLPLGAEGAPLPLTTTHRRKDGEPLTVEVSARAVVVAGRPCDIVVAVDVTARRQLEEQFLQAQRLEAVGQLAGGVAHDFNNLLTVISGFAAMLLEDMPENAGARRSAEQIQIASGRASDLTRSLLAFSRRQILRAKYVRLNDMIRETATMLSRLISEDIMLRLMLDAARDAVNVDPSQMQQVLINLAVNARDAMKKGGRLTISTRDLDDHVELRVSDTGTGIAAAALSHIFEPFFTTKQPGEGTGLGLPTVHGIVTQSGGTIAVDTEIGRGTTFIITLPRAERVVADEPEPVRAPVKRDGTRTVMLVEDDAGVRSLATIVLERAGYTVKAFGNGAAALDSAASSAGAVDVVLTDVVMPGMSGPELVGRLRSYYPALPVVYMSGYAEGAAARLDIDPASLDLLHKPFTPQGLLKRIDAALNARVA